MSDGKTKTLVFLALFFCGFAIYWNSLQAGFHLDDNIYILESPYFKKLSNIKLLFRKFMRPVSVSSLALNYHFNGTDTTGYHIVNITIHILSAFFVFLFVRFTLNLESLKDKYGEHSFSLSLLTAFMFLTHPIQTESVTYIVQRMTAMSGMFYFLSMYLYVKGRISTSGTRSKVYYFLAVLSFILGMGSKQNVAMVPVFILIYEIFFFQNFNFRKLRKILIIAAVVIVVFFLVYPPLLTGENYWAQLNEIYSEKGFTLKERVLTQPRVVARYISLMIFPHPSRLNLDYKYRLSKSLFNPLTTGFSILFIAVIILLSLYTAKRIPLISFCVLWFFGNMSIESSIIPLEIIFEHRTYIPSVGFFCLIAVLMFKLSQKMKDLNPLPVRKTLIGLGLIICVLYSSGTVRRNMDYIDDITLQADIILKTDCNERAWCNLGKAFQDASPEKYKKYKNNIDSHPELKQIIQNRLDTSLKGSKLDIALNCYKKAVSCNPDYVEALHNIGHIYKERRNYGKAKKYLLKAIRKDKDFPDPYLTLGIIRARRGNLRSAEKNFRKVIELQPYNAMAHKNLGVVYYQRGRYDKCIKHYEKALSLNPNVKGAGNIKKVLTKLKSD